MTVSPREIPEDMKHYGVNNQAIESQNIKAKQNLSVPLARPLITALGNWQPRKEMSPLNELWQKANSTWEP